MQRKKNYRLQRKEEYDTMVMNLPSREREGESKGEEHGQRTI